MTDTSKSSISLLSPQSTGGINAQGGFDFQHHYILANIPLWLSRDGFTSLIQEAAGDVELKYYVPGKDFQRDFFEIKDHQVTPTEFWAEIKRFIELDRESPGTYREFTLVASSLSKTLEPLKNGLSRLRGPDGFYDKDSEIWKVSYRQYEQIVEKLEGDETIANFIYKKVVFATELSGITTNADGIFVEALQRYFPEYSEIPGKILRQIPGSLKCFLRDSVNKVITRRDFAEIIRGSIPSEHQPPIRPITLDTGTNSKDHTNSKFLNFEWSRFFGGAERIYPPKDAWNRILLKNIQDTRQWILDHGNTRHINLVGNRRLSATFALGQSFSAVAGFVIGMEYRDGQLWSTNDFPSADTPGCDVSIKHHEGSGEHLILCLSVLREILGQVQNSLEDFSLDNRPILEIMVNDPIVTSEQANKVISQLKATISDVISRRNCQHIHLFYAGPSPLALFLGHRLNATATIQCYEWMSTNKYVPTCTLT